MTVKEEIRSQIIGALSGAKFPIYAPEELLNTLPAGVDACYKSVVEVTAKEAGYLLKYEDFPFISAEQAADTIVERAGL
jgi:hypothetical protein